MTVNHDDQKHVQEEDSMSGGLKILLPTLLLCLITAAIFYFNKGCNSNNNHAKHEVIDSLNHDKIIEVPATATYVAKGTIDTLSGDFIYDLGDNITVDLPNSQKITVGKYSTEYRLIEFLKDRSAMLDTVKGNWFEFTNVRFKSGGSELLPSSEEQLKNLVQIAKAFPTAQFKIGGYTDNSGNKQMNLTLSQKRADAVARKIKSLGASDASITGATGYGIEWPIADNTTAEGRAQNRRVAVNVKAK